MDWLWAAQLTWNLLATTGGVVLSVAWWRDRARLKILLDENREDRIKAHLNVLEARAHQFERDAREAKARTESALTALSRICDEANLLLSRGRAAMPRTREEEELQDLQPTPVMTTSESAEIPTLKELEQAKQRLKPEMALDLRSLLRDQLS